MQLLESEAFPTPHCVPEGISSSMKFNYSCSYFKCSMVYFLRNKAPQKIND